MTLGVHEACRALGLRLAPVVAIDISPEASNLYAENFGTETVRNESILQVIDQPFGEPPSRREREFVRRAGSIDLCVAGPPCQGNSALNNVTRHADPKNALYERIGRFAELVRPRHIIVENVPEILHDKKDVVDRTYHELFCLDYSVDQAIVETATIGVAQGRKRHIMIASLRHKVDLAEIVRTYATSARSVAWAIRDLTKQNADSVMDTPAKPNRDNLSRMKYLFSRDVYDLPDRLRPDCHRLKQHSYKSIYGRLHWKQPAQTITSGFGCMGQGRYVHPSKIRTLTPHEAARLQFIPSFFSFDSIDKKTVLSELIGNAVPPKLTYVLALELLR